MEREADLPNVSRGSSQLNGKLGNLVQRPKSPNSQPL